MRSSSVSARGSSPSCNPALGSVPRTTVKSWNHIAPFSTVIPLCSGRTTPWLTSLSTMFRSKSQRKKPLMYTSLHFTSTPAPIHLIASQIDWICLSATCPYSLAHCAPFQTLAQVLCAPISSIFLICAVPLGGERLALPSLPLVPSALQRLAPDPTSMLDISTSSGGFLQGLLRLDAHLPATHGQALVLQSRVSFLDRITPFQRRISLQDVFNSIPQLIKLPFWYRKSMHSCARGAFV
ncbi:unnamed protein product [Fusarium fujikuroi]|nr:unnamed protein product [Fusarium fujikuroi]